MAEIAGSYYSENGVFREVNSLDPSVFSKGTVLYEVLRIWQGKALFLEDHMNRLQQSLKLSGYSYDVSIATIRELLSELTKINALTIGNVKVNIVFTEDQPVVYAFFIPYAYPNAGMYERGVTAEFFHASRNNPNIKKLNPEMISQVNAIIKERQLYDVLLVGDDGVITEGSKTNVFFIRNNEIYTAPGSLVLRGITREKVISLCNDQGIKIHEALLHKEKLSDFNAAFFSGTSPKILPIRSISGIEFHTDDPLVLKLMKVYDDLIDSYLQN